MRHLLGKLGALVAGALAMYYFDPRSGAERRALLRDMVAGGLRQQAESGRARRARLRAYHHIPRSDPQSDAQLRERIQSALGRMASHPGAIDVRVENGVVRLSGDVLTRERDALLQQVRDMPGVQKLVNAMASHDSPEALASLEAREEARREPSLSG